MTTPFTSIAAHRWSPPYHGSPCLERIIDVITRVTALDIHQSHKIHKIHRDAMHRMATLTDQSPKNAVRCLIGCRKSTRFFWTIVVSFFRPFVCSWGFDWYTCGTLFREKRSAVHWLASHCRECFSNVLYVEMRMSFSPSATQPLKIILLLHILCPKEDYRRGPPWLWPGQIAYKATAVTRCNKYNPAIHRSMTYSRFVEFPRSGLAKPGQSRRPF